MITLTARHQSLVPAGGKRKIPYACAPQGCGTLSMYLVLHQTGPGVGELEVGTCPEPKSKRWAVWLLGST